MRTRNKTKLEKALLKKAVGYYSIETVAEYETGAKGERLVRRKVARRYNPPDIAALKELAKELPDVADLTDAELEAERARIIAELKASMSEQKIRI